MSIVFLAIATIPPKLLLTRLAKSSIIEAMVKPMKRGTMRSQLAEHISNAILHGDLKPGERIIEIKLARQLGVGQSTLREALQELEHRGLITKYGNRGTFVTQISTKEVESIYAVRLELEPLAASLASQRMSAQNFEELERHLTKMHKAQDRVDLTNMMSSDLAFHQAIWKFSDNIPLERALGLVCASLFTFYLIRFSANDFSRHAHDFDQDFEEHREMLAVLKKGGPEVVKQRFREILDVFRIRHLDHVQEAQDKEISSAAAKLPTSPDSAVHRSLPE